jgi:hypothetical protein
VLNLFPARQFGVPTQTESIAENTGLDEANGYCSHSSLNLGHIAVSAPGAPPLEPPPQPSPLILQRRLNIGQSGDKYEVENGYSSHSSLNLGHIAVSAPGAPPLEPPPQPSPLILQRRLNIGQSGDKYEVEADKGASQVVNLISSPLFRNIQSQKISSPKELEPESQRSIQRQSTGLNPFNISVYEPGTTPPPPIQTVQAKGDNIKVALGNIEDTIKSKKGSGEELADNVKEPMETAFDANFSRVKVHTDGESDQLNKSLNSRAFATGQDIFFSQGAYNPGSRDGQELLAHELTHIVQQNGLGKSSAVSKKEESETEIQKACAECEKEKNQSLEEKDVIQRKEVDQTKSPQATLSTTSTTETSTSVTKTDSNSSNSSTSEKQPVEAENSQKGDEEEKKSASAASVAIPSQTPKTETQDAAAAENSSASNPIAEKVQTKTGEEDVKLPKEAGATGEKAEKGQQEKSAPNTKLTEVPEAQALEQSVSNSQEVVPEVGSDPSTQQIATETAKAQGEAQTQQTELAATNAKVAQLASTGIDFGEPETEGDDASMVISPKGEAGGNHRPVLEQQRVNSSNQASAFLATAATKVQTITGLGENVPARVLAAAENAKATILTNVAQQKAAITAQMAQLRSQAQTEVQATLTQIQTQQQAANAGITQTTTTAKTKLEGEFTKANSTLAEKETSQAAKIEQLYQQALPKYKAAGEKIGNEASALAENRAKGYEAKIKGEDDSLLDGPLTDNRNKARAKAAREVGKQYKQGLVEEANKQGEKAQEGKAKDLEAVKQIANQSRQTLESQHQANLESLTSAEQTASSQIEQANTSLTQAAQKTLEATLQSLSQKEQSQLQTLTEYGQQQVTAIDGNAQKAIASLQQGINQAATSLQAALENFQAQSQGMGAPDPTVLSASLAQASGQIDQAIAQVQAQLETHLGAGEQGLTQAGQNAATSLNTISNGGVQEAQAVGTGLTTSVQQLSQSAGETFNKIQESHKTTVQTTTDTAIAGFTQVTQGIETAFTQTNQNLEQGITNSVTQLETGLRGALDKMSADIDKYAEEAAAQEQPRWKGILKILLMIAVIVVVALVAGPAVIGAVGAMAGALGASAAAAGVIGAVVGGAIVGAAAGAVTQMGNNLIDGKNLMEGVGQAMIVGAIGGALGGAGGALGQALGKAGSIGTGMTQTMMKFGIETGFDTVGNILGDLVSGNPITFESVMTSTLQGIGMSLAMSKVGKIKAVEATQTKFSDIGAGFGTSVGNKIKTGFGGGIDTPTTTPHVDTPNVKPPATEVKAPEAEVKPPVNNETDTPNGRTIHPDEPEVEPGIVAKEPTADGREIKITKEGEVLRCTGSCEIVQDPKVDEISNPKRKAEEAVDVVDEAAAKKPKTDETTTETSPETKVETTQPESAKLTEDIGLSGKRWDDPTMTEAEFIRDYQNRYPKSSLSETELKQHFQDGKRLNPETGRLAEPIRPIEPTGTRNNLPTQGEQHEAWQSYLNGDTSKIPCFPAGTLVKTSEGNKEIENIVIGELVFAYDFQAKLVVQKSITAVHKNWTQFIVVIETEQGKISSTSNHPYWVESENQWLRAVDIQEGMILRSINGDLLTVQSIITYESEENTYNFEVDQLHNYFVSSSGILVHNGDGNTSGFETTGTFPTDIYQVKDLKTGEVIYVGKTIQGSDTRFEHHITDPKSAVYDYINNPTSKGYIPPDHPLRQSPNFPKNLIDTMIESKPVRSGEWTRYETAVWEQHYINKNGGVGGGQLINRINAITPEKLVLYSKGHNPCI